MKPNELNPQENISNGDVFKLISEANQDYIDALQFLNDTDAYPVETSEIKRDINFPLSFVLK